MGDIRNIIDSIGVEVDHALLKKQSEKYPYFVLLLYSLIENLLKWLVASKMLWDETLKQTEAELEGNIYKVSWEGIRDKALMLNFNKAIDKAYNLQVINKGLKTKLHKNRRDRNNLIHELWVFEKRNDEEFMRVMLVDLKKTTKNLIGEFRRIMYSEIGLNEPEIFTLLSEE